MTERIRTLFRDQGCTIVSVLTDLSMTFSIIVLTISVVFGGGGRGEEGGSPSKNEGVLSKWLNRLADALKRLAGKAAEVLPAIAVSVVDAISVLVKATGFVAEHT